MDCSHNWCIIFHLSAWRLLTISVSRLKPSHVSSNSLSSFLNIPSFCSGCSPPTSSHTPLLQSSLQLASLSLSLLSVIDLKSFTASSFFFFFFYFVILSLRSLKPRGSSERLLSWVEKLVLMSVLFPYHTLILLLFIFTSPRLSPLRFPIALFVPPDPL